jgi:uncharacterized membrane protein YidH (DUF202 family)
LADNRTMLAWLRTALGAYGLAAGLGGIVPKIAPGVSSAYRVMGVVFALLGVLVTLVGVSEYIALRTRDPSNWRYRLNLRFALGIGLITALLGVAIAIVIGLGE